jgi:hypothetical protein
MDRWVLRGLLATERMHRQDCSVEGSCRKVKLCTCMKGSGMLFYRVEVDGHLFIEDMICLRGND